MDNALIKKLKNAINTSDPIEAINEIISEYDEILRLVGWRKKILLKGGDLKRHESELNKISKLIEESGYYICFCEKDLDMKVREYFENL